MPSSPHFFHFGMCELEDLFRRRGLTGLEGRCGFACAPAYGRFDEDFDQARPYWKIRGNCPTQAKRRLGWATRHPPTSPVPRQIYRATLSITLEIGDEVGRTT